MNNIFELAETINDQVGDFIRKNMQEMHRSDVTESGLDYRAVGHGDTYVSKDLIAVEGSTRMLEYYGGFEYVASEHRIVVGNYTFFVREVEGEVCERIARVCDNVFPEESDDSEEEIDHGE